MKILTPHKIVKFFIKSPESGLKDFILNPYYYDLDKALYDSLEPLKTYLFLLRYDKVIVISNFVIDYITDNEIAFMNAQAEFILDINIKGDVKPEKVVEELEKVPFDCGLYYKVFDI